MTVLARAQEKEVPVPSQGGANAHGAIRHHSADSDSRVHGRCRIEHWGRARVASDAATQLAARTQLFFPR
jgi:hypothetical protein